MGFSTTSFWTYLLTPCRFWASKEVAVASARAPQKQVVKGDAEGDSRRPTKKDSATIWFPLPLPVLKLFKPGQEWKIGQPYGRISSTNWPSAPLIMLTILGLRPSPCEPLMWQNCL